MPEQERPDAGAPVDRIVSTVRLWPGVSVAQHRYGGVEFALGPRAMAHVHESGALDVAIPEQVRDGLVDADRVEPHGTYPGSGWASYYLAGHPRAETGDVDPTPVDDAVWLLRVTYLAHALSLSNTPAGGEVLATIQVERELRDLDLDPALETAFDALRER